MNIHRHFLSSGALLCSLQKYDIAVPRYTSYPTAPHFHPISEELARQKWEEYGRSDRPLSIYIHIPFCRTMCLFCACSVILNRSSARQTAYLQALHREIEIVSGCFTKKRPVLQLHLGGGTPTSLSSEEMGQLMEKLRASFDIVEDAEVSIEVDPRTVLADRGEKLAALRKLGFGRVSFGVQDLDPKVQEAVRRRQSEEMTVQTYWRARELGFHGINIDLIYGLPLQTAETFRATVEKLVLLRPDRIALFSYAKVPWLKAHQKAIAEKDLPSTEEKFRIYVETRERLIAAGYTAIGMDHFALPEDSLSAAYATGKLMRNFQGYSVQAAEDLLGLGVTSIGYASGCYLQNVKTIEEYEERVSRGAVPAFRGFVLGEEDLRRKGIIQSLMCCFEVEKKALECAGARNRLEPFRELFTEEGSMLRATSQGRLFIRVIASAFDAYLEAVPGYSRAI